MSSIARARRARSSGSPLPELVANALTFVRLRQPKGTALRLSPILLCLALAACGPYPRDISGTLDRIEQSGRVRIGFTHLQGRRRAWRRAVSSTRIERATGAKPRSIAGRPKASSRGSRKASSTW